MNTIQPRLYSGLRDRLPEQMVYRNFVTDQLRCVFEKYGFEPLETPAIEYYDILTGKYGQEAENLIYRLAHRDGNTLALRYDLTVPLARTIGSNSELVRPIFKRYQIQQVWRGERPQKGRYREFTQCDIDAVGSSSMLVEAEILAIINEMMVNLGFDDFHILINNRKILDGMVAYAGVPDQLRVVCRSIDKLDKIGSQKVQEELIQQGISKDEIDRIFAVISLEGDDILGQLDQLIGEFGQTSQGIDELREIQQTLQTFGVPTSHYKFDPSLARGLDYYTGPIFEVVVKTAGIGSVVGGGRWDTLIGQYIGRDIPAVGTSFGLERLIDSMEKLNLLPDVKTTTQVLVAPYNQDMMPESLKRLAELRRAGINAEIYLEPKSFRQTFGYANRKGIPLALVIGPDELARNEVAVRDMETRQQSIFGLDQYIDQIKHLIHTQK